MRYFTADLHLGHARVAQDRGFETTESHDHAVMEGLSQLTEDDVLWVLGDISLGGKRHTEYALDLLASLPCPKNLILGNHDEPAPHRTRAHLWQRLFLEVFDSTASVATMKFEMGHVLLSHFPYLGMGDHTDEERYTQYRLVDEGRPLIHGHTHSKEKMSGPRSVCVSLDAWSMVPASEKELVALLGA